MSQEPEEETEEDEEEEEEEETSQGEVGEPFHEEYDEEQGLMAHKEARPTDGSEQRAPLSCAVVCCLMFLFSILISGATLATSFYGSTWAINKSIQSSNPLPVPPPTTLPGTMAPTVTPFPEPDAVVNCPEGNVPIELVIVFDSAPADIGIFLRDRSRSFMWNFGTGSFVSFSQLLRENYFIVCLSPQIEYQVEITDAAGNGLASEFVGQMVYGSFRLSYQNRVVTNYSGDCELEGYQECGAFCSCTYNLFENITDWTGQCTTDCSTSSAEPVPQIPATEAPATEVPATEAPATEAPSAGEPPAAEEPVV